MVRVPLNDFALVSRALDFGAEAIIAPMINSAADARQLRGRREISTLRRAQLGSAARHDVAGHRTAPVDYMREANEGTLTFAMIETATALGNVERLPQRPASMHCSSALTILRRR